MGKNKKSKIVFEKLELDSEEELQFIYWLLEAKEAGFVESWSYQPQEFSLMDKVVIKKNIETKTKVKKIIEKDFTLLNPHIYTPDFSVIFTELFFKYSKENKWDKIFKQLIENIPTIIDIKGSFNQGGGDRVFSINQKWVYQKHGTYIHKIIPTDLFKLTWIPDVCRLTKVKKQIIEKYKNFKSISDILNKTTE